MTNQVLTPTLRSRIPKIYPKYAHKIYIKLKFARLEIHAYIILYSYEDFKWSGGCLIGQNSTPQGGGI